MAFREPAAVVEVATTDRALVAVARAAGFVAVGSVSAADVAVAGGGTVAVGGTGVAVGLSPQAARPITVNINITITTARDLKPFTISSLRCMVTMFLLSTEWHSSLIIIPECATDRSAEDGALYSTFTLYRPGEATVAEQDAGYCRKPRRCPCPSA